MSHEMDQWDKKLLFVYLIGKNQQYIKAKHETWEKFVFQNAGTNTIQTHFYSPEKDAYPHEYANLHEDERYVIEAYKHPTLADVVNGEQKHRWIWRTVIELPKHHFTNVYKFSKKHTHRETLLCAIGAFNNVHFPPQVDWEEFDV